MRTRFVIDTNVWISYFFWESSVREAVKNVLRIGDVLHSSDTLAELAEVAVRPKFSGYLERAEREALVRWVGSKTIPIIVTERIAACRDPRDDKFLELAVAGKADIILSGDADLLALDPFQGVRILSPMTFLSV